MIERCPKFSDHETALLKDLAACVVVSLSEADLSDEARVKAMGAALEAARGFLYAKPKTFLHVVK